MPRAILLARATATTGTGLRSSILASHDPIGAMATINAAALEELLQDIETKSEALDAMFESMAQDAGFAPPDFEPVETATPYVER